jgi:hypothetical protein
MLACLSLGQDRLRGTNHPGLRRRKKLVRCETGKVNAAKTQGPTSLSLPPDPKQGRTSLSLTASQGFRLVKSDFAKQQTLCHKTLYSFDPWFLREFLG